MLISFLHISHLVSFLLKFLNSSIISYNANLSIYWSSAASRDWTHDFQRTKSYYPLVRTIREYFKAINLYKLAVPIWCWYLMFSLMIVSFHHCRCTVLFKHFILHFILHLWLLLPSTEIGLLHFLSIYIWSAFWC